MFASGSSYFVYPLRGEEMSAPSCFRMSYPERSLERDKNTKKTMSIINFSNVQWNAEVLFGF